MIKETSYTDLSLLLCITQTIKHDMIWCDVIWYDMIYDMVWYDIMIHDMIYDMVYDMIRYDIWYDMIWYDYDMKWYDMTHMVNMPRNYVVWHDKMCSTVLNERLNQMYLHEQTVTVFHCVVLTCLELPNQWGIKIYWHIDTRRPHRICDLNIKHIQQQ